MMQNNCVYLQLQLRKRYHLLLALCWISGLLCGILVYCSAADTLLVLMRSCIYSTVSFIGLLCVNLIPFLLSAFAIYLSSPLLLAAVCFGKAFTGVMVSLTAICFFGSFGWLCQCLMLFSSWTGWIMLYLFWLRIPALFFGRRESYALCLLTGCVLILLVDYCVISPFWACLIDF